MDTPHLPKSIFGHEFEHVYEPAEDTFLLLDALEKDLNLLNKNASICLECGSGSGTVITALSKSLNQIRPSKNRVMFATDINMRACETTSKCARYHGQNDIQVIRTDLAEALVDRLENSVDLLVFNPPYVPTIQDEIRTGTSDKPIYSSWAGGKCGRVLIDQFLLRYVPRLLSRPDGTAYLVALDSNDIDHLSNVLVDLNIQASVTIQRRAGIENLSVIKYAWMNN